MVLVSIDQWSIVHPMTSLQLSLENSAHPTLYSSKTEWFEAWQTRAIAGRRMYVGKTTFYWFYGLSKIWFSHCFLALTLRGTNA